MTTYPLRSRLTEEPKPPGKRISDFARKLLKELPAPKPYSEMTEEELDRVSEF